MAPSFSTSSLLLLLMSFFQFSSTQPLCHEFERFALEQFKDSFLIKRNASDSSLAYPKTDLWKSQGSDCCSWEGITCSQHTGHVVGIELNSSCLFGSLNSSSTLFNLGHLRYLNLADNHFNHSSIPPAFGNLSRLISLDLFYSVFSGQVPFEISKLSKLTKLDLSWNFDPSTNQGFLELRVQDFKSLIRNLTRLDFLSLSSVNINSSVPHALANFSSLTYLGLSQCGLFGEFPNAIFQLPKLENLYVHDNLGLTGIFPEFHFSSPLKELDVSKTSFFGEIPKSFGLLSSLEYLKVETCNFSGILPPSLSNLTELYHLNLNNNSFEGSLASFFLNLTQLDLVDLGLNLFTFSVVPSLARSTNLGYLDLSRNQITGPFPSWLTNLTQLTHLDLHSNMIQGTLPSSISRLKNLETFDVGSNKLNGTVELDTLLGLQHLKDLALYSNSFSVLTKNASTNNTTIPKFTGLHLGSCNLKEFPAFLRNQDQLLVLNLWSNNIHGQIPKWLLEMSPNLEILDLSNNSLTCFEKSYYTLPPSLKFLFLDFNLLRGSLPIPPHSISIYTVSSNQFNGEIPLEFCNMTSLQWFDLSGNNLSGIIPQCLGNRSTRLSNLNLGQNNLRGELPRPLANCKDLESLDVSDNQIRDTFPSWLGLLPHLKIIILRSNRLYGEIDGPKPDSMFPELRIVDLSHNEFLGPLPLKYFLQWNVMANIHDDNKATYLDGDYDSNNSIYTGFPYTMTITNKGNKMRYEAILNIFAAIDLSSNKFSGGILETVGNLRKLELLNLSNNVLVGPIPPALGNLSKLEALDLSSNKLSGSIPTELTQLNFLEVFDVSNNLLTGPIPRGSQLDTFENSSFEGNPGLCGMPLSKKCGNHAPPLPSSSEENGHISFLSEIGWRAVLIGCGCGFLGGVVLGVKVFARKQEWFMTTFRIKQGRRSGFRRS